MMGRLTIHGVPISRASRPIWAAEELGLDYALVTGSFAGRDRSGPDFMALNPNGAIPVIDDDGFVLWESMAITLYLVRKHGGPLAPASLEEDALMMQWSFWAMTELEKAALELVLNRIGLPEPHRDEAKARHAAEKLVAPLDVLERVLNGRRFLVGERFTIADLNVCSVLIWAKAAAELFAARPHVAAYLAAAQARPAYGVLRGLQRGASPPSWVSERAKGI